MKKSRPKILAFIPARGGSQRLKNKNLKKINYKPLIYYPISIAKKSKYINKIIVSTDSNKIKNLSIKYGASVPFLRPKELSTSTSSVVDALIYTAARLKKELKYKFDYVLTIQPTNPLINYKLIDKAIKIILKNNSSSLVGVLEVDTTNHPYNIRCLGSSGNIKFWKKNKHYNYQNRIKPKFYRAGGIYLSSYNLITSKNRIESSKNNDYIIMDKISALDIDTSEDLEIIKKIINK